MRRFYIFIFSITTFAIFGQSVGIGTVNPDVSSLLEISSTDKGLLIPRMDSMARSQITSPALGLMVYQTNGNKGFYYHTGSSWTKIGGDGNEWTKNGANEIYTTKAIGIGNQDPNDYAIMDITSTEKGILIPRMTEAQRNAILNPDEGLLIFQTGTNKGLYYFDGSNDSWKKVGDGPFSWTDGNGTVYTNNRVGIGTALPNNAAILDLTSTNKGFLLPRMTTAQRDAISAPLQGLKIFNTDDRCEDTYDGLKWSKNCDMNLNGDVSLNSTWRPRSDFHINTSNPPKGFVINGQIYVYYNASGNNFWSFNPATNQWTPKANFPGANRNYGIAFSIDSIGYFGLGGSNLNDIWAYNANSNSWIQKNNFGGSGRSRAVGFSIGSKGYVGTGQNASGQLSDFWEYNPSTDSWTEKNSFDGGIRTNAIGFSINGKGYIGTGFTGSGFTNDFWEFTPSSSGGMGTWVARANVPGATSRQNAVGFSIGTIGYAGSGDTNLGWARDFYYFSPSGNFWTQLEDIGGNGRYNAFGVSVGNKGYIGMGSGGQNYKDFWEYNTSSYTGKEYKENIPTDAVSYIGHDWTSKGKQLYTTNSGLEVNISGNTNISGNAEISGSLDIGYNNGVPNSFVNINEENYEATLTDGGLFCIGNRDTFNIVMDGNEIQARDKISAYPYYVASYLQIQPEGGLTLFGGNVEVNGDIDVEGKVAINSTYAPSALYIKGLNNTNSRHIQLEDDNSLESTYIYCSDNFVVKNTSATGDFYFVNGSGPSDVNVLTVNTSGNLTISGSTATKASGSSWANPSDIRLKQNINNYNSGLKDVLKIRPVTFNYKSNPKETVVGVIAQELQLIAPDMVSESQNKAPDGSHYLQVDNSAMTYMLINAVKDLAKQNEELKLKLQQVQLANEELKTKCELDISSLQSEIESIKELIFNQKISNK